MVRLFRSSSSNAEISEGLGVPTSASVRQALKKYNAKAAPRAVRDVLKELGGITKVLEDATLQEMHKVLTTEDSLRDIVKVITEPPTSTVSEMDVPVSSPREEHLEQWVGSVLITHGPTEFRVNLLKSNALVLLLLKFYNENPAYDEVQTSLVTKVVSAVHSENDGTVGNVLSQNPDVVIGMFNRIECSTVSNLVPRLLVDVEPSHKYPFDYENAHRRSAWALYNAGVYEVLSSRFAKTACKSSYELKDVKILENCAYTIGELAGRTACLERVSEAELASMVAQSSARLYGSARIGLDMYRNPTTLVNLLACGLKEYTKRRRAQRANNASGSNAVGPTEDIALQCALKALLLMLRRHEQGLRCSERIAKALRGTNTAAMEEKLKRFIPDFMSIIKSGIQQRSLVQFQITEVLSYCLVLFKEMSFYLFEQGVLDVLVATASAHNGVAYLQLEIGAFTAALRGKDLKLQIAWLRNKTFIDFIMNEATRDSADRSRQANARLALWELKTFLEARQGGDANPRASHSNGLENLLQRINSIPLDKVQDDLFGYLIPDGCAHPRNELENYEKIDSMNETDRESMYFYNIVQNEDPGANSEGPQQMLDRATGGQWLPFIFNNRHRKENPRQPMRRNGTESTPGSRNGTEVLEEQSARPQELAPSYNFEMSRTGSESNRSADGRSRLPFTMGRAASESSTLPPREPDNQEPRASRERPRRFLRNRLALDEIFARKRSN